MHCLRRMAKAGAFLALMLSQPVTARTSDWSSGIPLRPASASQPLAGEAFGTTIHGLGRSPEDLHRRLQALQHTGVRHLRENFLWQEIEPRPGVFNFARADYLVNTAAAYGIELTAILCYDNTNYSAGTDIQTSIVNAEAFSRFAGQLAGRYRGVINNYEIWNEPNAYVRFFKAATPRLAAKRYGILLQQAHSAIKGINPDANVILGGLFEPNFSVDFLGRTIGMPGGRRFLDMLAEEAPAFGDSVDAIGWHPYRYPQTAPEASAPAQPSLVHSIQGLAERWDKPVYVTEMGYHTAERLLPFIDGVGLREQGSFLVRSFLLSLHAGAKLFIWYQFTEGGEHPFKFEDSFGVYSEDVSTPKPAHQSMKTMLCLLAPTRLKGSAVGLQAGHYRMDMEGIDRSVSVLWRQEMPLAAWVVRLPPGSTVFDMQGQPLAGPDIAIGTEPVYVVTAGKVPEHCITRAPALP